MNGRIHSERFKAEALRKLATSGRSVREVAAEMGVHETLLYRWRRESASTGPRSRTSAPPTSSSITPDSWAPRLAGAACGTSPRGCSS